MRTLVFATSAIIFILSPLLIQAQDFELIKRGNPWREWEYRSTLKWQDSSKVVERKANITALNQIRISGRLNNQNGHPVPFANITLKSIANGDTLYHGTTADIDGQYTFITSDSVFLGEISISYIDHDMIRIQDIFKTGLEYHFDLILARTYGPIVKLYSKNQLKREELDEIQKCMKEAVLKNIELNKCITSKKQSYNFEI